MSIQVATPHPSSTVRALGSGMLASLTSGSIAGLVDGPGAAARAVAALIQAGVDRRSIEVVESANCTRGGGLLAGLSSRLPALGPERGIACRYRAGLRAGGVLLVVRGAGAEVRQRAAVTLRDAGGRAIYDFGRFTVRTVAP